MRDLDVLAAAHQELGRARSIVDMPWDGVRFVVTDSVRQMGYCQYADPVLIGLSRHHSTQDALRQTARHELAHLVAYRVDRYVGHGQPWRIRATQLGTSSARTCGTDTVSALEVARRYRFLIYCGACNRLVGKRQTVARLTARHKSGCCHAPLVIESE